MGESTKFNGTALGKVIILQEVIEPTIDAATGLEVSNDSDKNDKTKKGLVVAIGESVPKNEKGRPYVNPKDYVLYNKHQASNITHDGQKYKMLYYDDLVMKL